MITIVIPTYNRQKDVLALIASIKKSDYAAYRIVVVDDGSSENIREIVSEKFVDVVVIRNENNIGAAASRNRGIRKYQDESDYLLFLDSDETVGPDAIRLLAEVLESDEKIGAVTPSVYYYEKPELLQYGEAGVDLLTGINYSGNKNMGLEPREVQMCGGNFMMRTSIINKVGYLDEAYHVFYEDADYSYRIVKAGFKLMYVPKAKVYHKTPILDKKEGTRKWLSHAYLTARNKIIFVRKHSPGFFLFILFYPIYVLFYIYKSLQYRDIKALREFCRGIKHGFGWALRYQKPR